MDPISSLIGAGVSAVGGFLGRQQQKWQMEGGYLPGLIANARAAGINPLAVLGMGGKSGSADISSAFQSAGGQVSRIDPFELQLKQDQIRRSEREINLLEAQINNQTVQTGITRHALDQLLGNRNLLAPGVQEPTLQGSILTRSPGVLPNLSIDPNSLVGRLSQIDYMNYLRAAGRGISSVWNSRDPSVWQQ